MLRCTSDAPTRLISCRWSARITDPSALTCILRTRWSQHPTGGIRTFGDERRMVVYRPIVVDSLEQLADDRIGFLVTLRTHLRQQDQAHDGRFIAIELVLERLTPILDGRCTTSVRATHPRLFQWCLKRRWRSMTSDTRGMPIMLMYTDERTCTNR